MSIESQKRFFGEGFFEADALTQTAFQAFFFNSDIVNLPVAAFPGCYDIFCDILHEGEEYLISKNPFGGLHHWRKKPYFASVLHSPVRTRDDLASIPAVDTSKFEKRVQRLAQDARKLSERGYFVMAQIKGPFEAAWMFLRGLTPYLKDLVTDPDLVARMTEVSFKPMMDLAEMVVDEAPVDGLWVNDDLGERQSPFVSVEKYRRLYQPWHKELVHRIHKKGAKVCLHSDGNVGPLMGEFVEDGFDSVDPLEPADNIRLVEIKEQYGDRIALMGGITRDIGKMTPEEIDKHIQGIVKDAGPCGLILNCGGGVPPDMSLEALMHYSATIEKYRRFRSD